MKLKKKKQSATDNDGLPAFLTNTSSFSDVNEDKSYKNPASATAKKFTFENVDKARKRPSKTKPVSKKQPLTNNKLAFISKNMYTTSHTTNQ